MWSKVTLSKFVAVYWEDTGELFSVGRDVQRDERGNATLHAGLAFKTFDDTQIPYDQRARRTRHIEWHPRDRTFAPVSPPEPEPPEPTVRDVLDQLGERPTREQIEAAIDERIEAKLAARLDAIEQRTTDIEATLTTVDENVRTVRDRTAPDSGTATRG